MLTVILAPAQHRMISQSADVSLHKSAHVSVSDCLCLFIGLILAHVGIRMLRPYSAHVQQPAWAVA